VCDDWSVVVGGPPPFQAVTGRQDPPFVGREVELALLDEWWQQARAGRRQIVFVAAPAGVGKTALVDVFVDRLRNGDSALFGRGECVEQFGESEAYLPILEALSGLCRGPHGKRVRETLRSVAPTWLIQLPALLEPAELDALRPGTVGASPERMLREMGDALTLLTAEQPLLLVCEELHQSDRSTTELLAYLARRRDPARLLLVGTYRSTEVVSRSHPLRDVVRDLRSQEECGFLRLELLSQQAVATYVGARLAPARPAETLIAEIHELTDGNALFMATVLDYLIDHDLLDESDGVTSSAEGLDRLGIPDTLGQFIEQQLQELAPQDRQLLEIAAAVGVDFSAATVLAGAGEEWPELQAKEVTDRCSTLAWDTGVLVERELAEWPDGTVTGRYRFHHSLYQEVLYRTLPADRRVGIHRRVGARLAAGFGSRAGEIAAELAMHFQRGEDFEQAIPFLARAAETALQRAAHREALEYANRGLELIERTPGIPDQSAIELRLRMMQTVALVTLHGAGAPGVEQAYRQARAVSAQIDDAMLLGPVLYGLWNFAFNRGRMSDATELSDELHGLVRRQSDPILEMQAHGTTGYNHVLAGHPATALPHLERCHALYDPTAHRQLALVYGEDPGVNSHQWAAYATWLLGYPDRARRHATEARGLALNLGYPNDIAQATWFGTVVNILCRDLYRARQLSDALLKVCREFELTRWSALAQLVRAWMVGQAGEPQRAVQEMREGLSDYSGASGFPYFSSSLLAETLSLAGDAAAALETISGALVMGRRTGQLWYAAELARLRGETLLRLEPSADGEDHATDAERAFGEALDIARRQQAKSLELRATMSLAQLYQSRGETQRAHSLLSGIYRWFTEGHETGDLQAAAALLDELR
jgi:tetratricopeptide (TPR) repeat protein